MKELNYYVESGSNHQTTFEAQFLLWLAICVFFFFYLSRKWDLISGNILRASFSVPH